MLKVQLQAVLNDLTMYWKHNCSQYLPVHEGSLYQYKFMLKVQLHSCHLMQKHTQSTSIHCLQLLLKCSENITSINLPLKKNNQKTFIFCRSMLFCFSFHKTVMTAFQIHTYKYFNNRLFLLCSFTFLSMSAKSK